MGKATPFNPGWMMRKIHLVKIAKEGSNEMV